MSVDERWGCGIWGAALFVLLCCCQLRAVHIYDRSGSAEAGYQSRTALEALLWSASDFVKEVSDCLQEQADLAQQFPEPRDAIKTDKELSESAFCKRSEGKTWELDYPRAEEAEYYVSKSEFNSLTQHVKKLNKYKTKRSELLQECERDVAARRDVMDMHDAEWSKLRKTATCAFCNILPQRTSTAPRSLSLRQKRWSATQVANTARFRYYSKQLHRWTSQDGPVHKPARALRDSKAFEAKDSSPLLRKPGASRARSGSHAMVGAPDALGQAWTTRSSATARKQELRRRD